MRVQIPSLALKMYCMGTEPKPLFSSLPNGSGSSGKIIPTTPAPAPKSLFDTTTKAVSGVMIVRGETPKPTAAPKSVLGNGKVRRRVEVELDDLRKYHNSVEILKKSRQQILETNLDELCLKYVLDWGSSLQKTHADYIQGIMQLSTAKSLELSKGLLAQIINSLGELDVVDATKDSWFKSKEKKVDNLMGEVKELQAKVNSLESHADNVMELHDLGVELKTHYKNLIEQIQPYIVSCSFFSEHEKDGFPKELYISRLSSLLSTEASIRNDVQLLESLLKSYLTLVETMNSIIRNELPMWCSNLVAVLTGKVADIASVQANKNSIIEKLKKTQ